MKNDAFMIILVFRYHFIVYVTTGGKQFKCNDNVTPNEEKRFASLLAELIPKIILQFKITTTYFLANVLWRSKFYKLMNL